MRTLWKITSNRLQGVRALLKLLRCEFAKLKRKPLFFAAAAISALIPLGCALFLPEMQEFSSGAEAVDRLMSTLFQLSAYLLLMPAVVVLASNLLFEEQDNDIVLNGLADGTNQALDALSEADDGQAKNSILEAFGKFVDDAGTAALTPQSKLQGHKKNGADDYTGSYEATYSDFAGTEILFGGTTLEREAGSTLHITCSLSLESGKAAVFLRSGADDPTILLSESGEYDGTVEVDGTSTYIGVWGDQADGTVSIEIE